MNKNICKYKIGITVKLPFNEYFFFNEISLFNKIFFEILILGKNNVEKTTLNTQTH